MITKIGAAAALDPGLFSMIGKGLIDNVYTPLTRQAYIASAPLVGGISGVTGALGAATLEDDERDALAKHYGVENSRGSMALRNGIRTGIGGIAGLGLGYGAWHLLKNHAGIDDPFIAGGLLGLTTATGLNIGADLSDRYNAQNAHDIMVENMRKEKAAKN